MARVSIAKMILRLAYAERWLIYSIIIGAFSGLFAYCFYELLHYTEGLTLWILGEYPKCCTRAEGLASVIIKVEGIPLLLPLVVILGAGISSVLVYKFAPTAEGHGTDAALEAFHRRAALIPFKVPIVKALASSATIGFGGSGGVEGPSAQMGAGIGSSLAKALGLPLEARRVALVSGMAAALSALFQSPLGTALFAVEVLYKRDLETQAVIPAILASIVSYAITAPLFGFKPVLPTLGADPTALYGLRGLASIALLGALMAPLAVVYVILFYKVKNSMDSFIAEKKLPVYVKPLIGALGTGVLALVIPHVIGSGRDVLGYVLRGRWEEGHWTLLGLPLTVSLLIIALAKMLATAFSIGSGGSGGVFAPSLLVGALVGASYGTALGARIAPLDPSVYAYIGMAAFFGAAAKVPFSAAVLIGEMGRNYLLIPPALLAGVIARELAGDLSLYASQLRVRLRTEVLGAEYLYEILKSRGLIYDVRAEEIVNRRPRPARLDDPLLETLESMLAYRTRAVAVVDSSGRVVGVIEEKDLESLLAIAQEKPTLKVMHARLRTPPVVREDDRIDRVLEEMLEYDADYAVVIDGKGSYVGIITVDDVLAVLAHVVHEHLEELRGRRGSGSDQRQFSSSRQP